MAGQGLGLLPDALFLKHRRIRRVSFLTARFLGEKDMKKEISDEQVDRFMRSLLTEAALDDDLVNEIADSPKLWWQVQSGINRQKTEARSPWPPPIQKWIFLLGTSAAIASAMLIAVFVWPGQNKD